MFTTAEEERLIDAVRSFPILYNRTPKTNENSGEKEACWNRISQFVGKDGKFIERTLDFIFFHIEMPSQCFQHRF